jgi:hypothetical protein
MRRIYSDASGYEDELPMEEKEDDRFISFAVVRMNEIPPHLATEYLDRPIRNCH